MDENTETRKLTAAVEKLTREAARLRRDVRYLLGVFVPLEPDDLTLTKEPPPKTLDATLDEIASAARGIRSCEFQMTFLRNVIDNFDLTPLLQKE